VFLLCPAPAGALPLGRQVAAMTDAFHNILNLRPSDATNWRLGIGPSIAPTFEGGDRYSIQPAPMISVHYRDVLKVENNNIDFTAFDQVLDLGGGLSGRFDFGPVVNLDFGRSEHDDYQALHGLGNIGTAVEIGGYMSLNLGRLILDAEMSQDIADGHGGADLDLHGALLLYQDAKLTVAPDVTVTWVTARYMKSFFGVTETQSIASGLPTYRPGSGFKNATFSLLTAYDVSPHWSVLAHVAYKRMLDGAAASPIVQLRGDPEQWYGGLFVVRVF
jgi:outer membrane protein